MFQKIGKMENKNVDVFYMEMKKRIREVITIGDEKIEKWINVYQVAKQMTDEEIISKQGHQFDESHYKIILDEDADVYDEDGGLILKLRKKVIPEDLCDTAVECFRTWSKKFSTNRGASAGLLDKDKLRPGYRAAVDKREEEDKDKKYYGERYRANVKRLNKKTGKTSNQSISNLAPSNIVGYIDSHDRNTKPRPKLPCRLTAFTKNRVEEWKQSLPFFERCDNVFKALVPSRHATQLAICSKTPQYQIGNTAFSTATINSSWRTSCHKDGNDLEEGFGNIVVCEDKKNPMTYKGCYTGFPQYKICANVRHGDFMAMDVHRWHCNTEFKISKLKKSDFKSDKQRIEYKNNWDTNRLSVVMYYRKKMIKCAQ